MDILFTTVVRYAPLDKGGELVKLNWEKKQIVKRVPIIPFDPNIDNDPNPRGNSRGGRGILIRNGHLLVATYHSLHIYDLDLNYKGKISHPLFVGLHEVCQDENLIWVSSTAIDAVIGVDMSGTMCESWWPRESPFLQRHLGISPLKINKTIDNRLLYLDEKYIHNDDHLHLNAVAVKKDKLLALLGRHAMVFDLASDKILIENSSRSDFHNLVITDEYILTSNTRERKLMIYSHDGSFVKAIDLLGFREVANVYKKAGGRTSVLENNRKRGVSGRRIIRAIAHRIEKANIFAERTKIIEPLFVRGLFQLSQNRVLIGFSPATIIEIDYEKEKLLDLYRYSDDVAIAPHGLLALP